MAGNETTVSLLHLSGDSEITNKKIPKDSFNLAYIIYFILGIGYLLPWNAFITAVDYFQYLYPDRSVDRTFSVVSQLVMLFNVLLIIFCFRKSHAYVRVNLGLGLFLLALLVVPLMDVFYIMGQSGLYIGYYITVGAVGLSAMANGFVQASLIGSAGELPDRYMQALFSGTGASGLLVSSLRIFTKAIYPQDTHGLRSSAILYFAVGIILMIICIILYNMVRRLPVIKYYNELRAQAAASEEKHGQEGSLSGPVWEIMVKIKWYGISIVVMYVVTLSVFPGFITENVHSEFLGNWFGILLITSFNVFDLVGKSMTAVYPVQNGNVAIAACFARLLFYPLYLGCLYGPQVFRTEIPVTLLTFLLGLTNGYFTSCIMILVPKSVQLRNAETAGILIALFLIVGLAVGSIVSWFWVI
uniref:Equilibrative nucleoside transporter 1 n=2 Tax=Chenopodium quinoa TaxID=63459 RepID=A0A803LJ75_CHEQI